MRTLIAYAGGLLALVGCKPEPGSDSFESNTSAAIQSCDAIVATGFGAGEVPEDFELRDADGMPRTLHEHCGSVIVIVAGAAW